MSVSTHLLVGLLLASIGLGYWSYGRKQGHRLAYWCGLALMVLPYFFSHLWWLLAVSVALMAAPLLMR